MPPADRSPSVRFSHRETLWIAAAYDFAAHQARKGTARRGRRRPLRDRKHDTRGALPLRPGRKVRDP